MSDYQKLARAVSSCVRWGLHGFVALLLLMLALTGLVGMCDWFWPPKQRVEDAPAEFSRYSGLPWPESATLVAVGDSHGSWREEGEFYLVCDVDRAAVAAWLSAPPPWKIPTWRSGGVPSEIAQHCNFGAHSSPYTEALQRRSVTYCCKDRTSPHAAPWRHGQVFAVDTELGRAYLSWWW